jgi:hypothetical protein
MEGDTKETGKRIRPATQKQWYHIDRRHQTRANYQIRRSLDAETHTETIDNNIAADRRAL